MSANSEKYPSQFPISQGDILKCSVQQIPKQPKDIQFNIILEIEKQQIFTAEKLELENFWHFWQN